eukprot:5214889-Prymnesium_polylepis.1
MAIAALRCTLLPACRSFAVLPADWSRLLSGSGEVRGFLTGFAHLRGHAAARASVPSAAGAIEVAPTTAIEADAVLEM